MQSTSVQEGLFGRTAEQRGRAALYFHLLCTICLVNMSENSESQWYLDCTPVVNILNFAPHILLSFALHFVPFPAFFNVLSGAISVFTLLLPQLFTRCLLRSEPAFFLVTPGFALFCRLRHGVCGPVHKWATLAS